VQDPDFIGALPPVRRSLSADGDGLRRVAHR
jgi:hypothetical protein